MDFDNSWDALLNPGNATDYFDRHEDRKFNPNAECYDRKNAWWLAEMCRLIYRQGATEPKPSPGVRTRQEIWAEVGLIETFVEHPKAQCALVKPEGRSAYRVVIFRGSHDLLDWATNFQAIPTDCSTGGKVHEGFQDALDTVWERVSEILRDDESPVFFTGHSLGGALATLAAARYARSEKPAQLYSFGSPLVGDEEFSEALRNVPSYRIVNNRDLVTTVPPAIPPCEIFRHIPRLYYITHAGEIRAEPSLAEVSADLIQRDHETFFDRLLHRRLPDPPEPLADHAPINYVAHLERAL